MKKILALVIVLCMFLLVGCNRYSQLTKELNMVKEDPKHVFVGRAGITKDNISYSFIDILEKEIKKSKRKLYSETGYLASYIFIDDNMYFLYKYYWSGNKEKDYDKTTLDYCFGYFDVVKQELNVLEYFEKLSVKDDYSLIKVSGKLAYIWLGNRLLEYNIDGKKTSNEYFGNAVIYYGNNPATFILKEDFKYTLFTNDDTYRFNLDEDYTSYYLENNIIIFSRYDNETKKSVYVGFSIDTKVSIPTQQVEVIISNRGQQNPATYLIDNEEYYITVDEKNIKFQKVDEEDVYILNIEDVKIKNNEYKKIIEIFDKEGYFYKVLNQDNKLFIIIRNASSFFGIYDGAIPPLVFEFNIQSKDLKYLGYYSFVYYDVFYIYTE